MLFAQEAPFIYRYIFYQYTHISGSVIQLPYGSHDLSRAYVWCVCLLALACEHRTVKQVHDQAARAWCVAGGVRMCREVCAPRGGESTSAGATRDACVACHATEKRRETLTDRGVEPC